MLSKQDSVLGVSLRGLNHQTCIYLGHGKVPSHPVVPSSLMRFQPKEPETLRKLTLVYLLPTPFTMLALYLLVFAWDRLMRGTRAVNGAAPPPSCMVVWKRDGPAHANEITDLLRRHACWLVCRRVPTQFHGLAPTTVLGKYRYYRQDLYCHCLSRPYASTPRKPAAGVINRYLAAAFSLHALAGASLNNRVGGNERQDGNPNEMTGPDHETK